MRLSIVELVIVSVILALIGGYAVWHTARQPTCPITNLVVADLDGKGKPDIIVSDCDSIAVFRNDTPRGFGVIILRPGKDLPPRKQ